MRKRIRDTATPFSHPRSRRVPFAFLKQTLGQEEYDKLPKDLTNKVAKDRVEGFIRISPLDDLDLIQVFFTLTYDTPVQHPNPEETDITAGMGDSSRHNRTLCSTSPFDRLPPAPFHD